MKLPRSPSWLVALFDALQPEVGGDRKQMFGHPCAFENGHLFTGLFGDRLFVRLGVAERASLLQKKGAAPFEPMKGRPMREYVVLPASMLEDEDAVKSWMLLALENARSLPPKKATAKRKAAQGRGKKREAPPG